MNDSENKVIENYKKDEKLMILIYAQWCINNDLDPKELYKEAYPQQLGNPALEEALSSTVPKNDSEDISDEIVLNVLQVFGNDDLALVVQTEIEKRQK